MSNYIAKDVRCPYYIKEDGTKIHCEGVEDETYIHLVFKSPSIRRDYQLDVCCNDYNFCPIAKINNKKWEDEG